MYSGTGVEAETVGKGSEVYWNWWTGGEAETDGKGSEV